MKKIIVISILFVIFFISCNDEVDINSPTDNIPVIGNKNNAFSYNVVANSFTDTSEYNVTFSTDSLACSVTVTNHSGGNGSITVLDQSKIVIYTTNLTSDKLVGLTLTNNGIPKKVKIILNNFSGKLTFALSGGNGNN